MYATNKNMLMQQHLPKICKASSHSTEYENSAISWYAGAMTGRSNIKDIPDTGDVEQCKDVPTHFL